MSVELSFPPPGKPLSINEASGRSWARTRRLLAPWRDGVGWAWNTTPRSARAAVQGRRCRVEVTIPFATNRRRDPHNYVGSVVKALVDQLVDQGVWPDDTPDWVTVAEPTLVVGGDVVVRLTPLED